MPQPRKKGTLYLVATPIGNLEDISLRALNVLKEADLIACEDTRHTRRLLEHYGISKPTLSYHQHNEAERAAELMARLEQGAVVALVSDAGTPAVSDPGYRVVRLAAGRGLAVTPVPGASAVLAALAASGLPTDSFLFAGFLPARPGERRRVLEQARAAEETRIYYEAPHRIEQALEDIVEILGPERPVVLARELTKLHEEFLRGSAAEILAEVRRRGGLKGEITLLIGKGEHPAPEPAGGTHLRARLEALMRERSLDEKAALKVLAKELGLSRSEAYRRLQRER